MNSLVKTELEKLEEGLSTWKYCYSRVAVSYIAISHESIFHLLVGQLELGTEIDLPEVASITHRNSRVIAGRFLAHSNQPLEKILGEASEGRIQAIGPLLELISPDGKPKSAFYTGDVEDSRSGFQLVRNLYLDGSNKQDLSSTWYRENQVVEALQASRKPFKDLVDLADDIGLRRDLLGRGSSLLISGRSPARFDAATRFFDTGEVVVSFSTGKIVHTGNLTFSYIARKGTQIVGRDEIANLHSHENRRPAGGQEFTFNLPAYGADSMSLFLSYGGSKLLAYELKAPPKQERRKTLSQPTGPGAGSKDVFNTAFDVYTSEGSPKGEGGTGRVYPVTDSSGQTWAVKVIKRDTNSFDEKVKRFRNELGFCFRTRHHNVLRVHDWGYITEKGAKCPFYVMPFYRKTFRNLLDDQVENSTKFLYWRQMLNGLKAAHRERVIHRDMKPENVLIDELDATAIVADFGIAHFDEEYLWTSVVTHAGQRMANFKYAAPEQKVKGEEIDQRTDIFAMGLILNEMFTGTLPDGVGFPEIGEHAPLYAPLDEVVHRMINHNRTKRHDSLDDVEAHIFERLPPELLVSPERAEDMPAGKPSAPPET